MTTVDSSVLEFPDVAGWESWLAAEHDVQAQAWLRIGKRHSGMELIATTDALDGALCFGWIEAAKADGRWAAAYESQRTAEVPPDLAAALTADPVAVAAFERLSRSERYAVLLPLLKARTPGTRALMVAQTIDRLSGRQ